MVDREISTGASITPEAAAFRESGMIGARRLAGLAASVAVAALLGLVLTASPGRAAEKGMGKHPDFSGLWFPSGFGKQTPKKLPFTPEAQKQHDEYVKAFTSDDDPGRYCITPGMPRAIWGAPFAVEIFHRPQDMTIYWEGYNMYRKIYMADHPHPDPIIDTQMGYAVAHWDGDTLVVETDHLRQYPYMNRLATSDAAKIEERIHMEEREVNGEKHKFLVDQLTLTDPKVYTEPVHIEAQLMYRPDTQVLEYSCSDLLWDDYLQKRGLHLPDLDSNTPAK